MRWMEWIKGAIKMRQTEWNTMLIPGDAQQNEQFVIRIQKGVGGRVRITKKW